MEELRNHLEYFTKDFVSFLETVIVENDYGKFFYGLTKMHVAGVLRACGTSQLVFT